MHRRHAHGSLYNTCRTRIIVADTACLTVAVAVAVALAVALRALLMMSVPLRTTSGASVPVRLMAGVVTLLGTSTTVPLPVVLEPLGQR